MPLRAESLTRQDDHNPRVEARRDRANIALLDSNFIGKNRDQLQLKFLHASRDYRKQGLGRMLWI